MPNPNPFIEIASRRQQEQQKNALFSPEVVAAMQHDKAEEVKQPQDIEESDLRRIAHKIISNAIVLLCDYGATSMPYGMALKAESLVEKPKLRDFVKPAEWVGAYKRTWGVLKYGFWPTFLLEVAAAETTKRYGTPFMAAWADTVMPGVIGAGTAPAVSFAAINTRFKTNLDVWQVLRTQGVSGVTRYTGGAVVLGAREALCYQIFHHDSSPWAKIIADKTGLKNKDGKPNLFATLLASTPDGLGLLATQPMTMFGVNSAIRKYMLQQSGALAQKPGLTAPAALLKWQLQNALEVCRLIQSEGRSHGLNSFFSFSPGVVARTASLFGTLAVFKHCLPVAEQVVHDHVTHRKP